MNKSKYARLLAKCSETPDQPHPKATLQGHTRDVLLAAQALVNKVGRQAIASLGLPEHFFEKLRPTLQKAAILHDLGKASHHFQRMIRQSKGEKNLQAYRHEKLSVYLLGKYKEALCDWLFEEHQEDILPFYAAIFAVLGHHLKTQDLDFRPRNGTGDDEVEILSDLSDFFACLELAAKETDLELAEPPKLPRTRIDLLDAHPLKACLALLEDAEDWFEEASIDQKLFVSLCKILLMAADTAGSILGEQKKEAGAWTQEALARVCEREEIQEVISARLGKHPVREFQSKVAETLTNQGDVIFVRAGCGSGKTVAAYMWAEQHAVGRQLFICYPTTGTATEGFADYLLETETGKSSLLLHSRRAVDMERLFTNGERELGEEDNIHRVQALEAWYHPLIICTVDQVLGLIQNQRRPIYASPAILRGAFVFDEIHLYDRRLFGAFLRFLEAFRGVPILLMTASLPEARLKRIREVLQNQGRTLHEIAGPREREELPRYHLQPIQEEPPWEEIEAAIQAGKKILWVSNTVNRCVEMAKKAEEKQIPVIAYHSRYRYDDRLRCHKDVIEAFAKEKDQAILACTTQVCEVSLDISADILISDLAPIPALIQRMGRLNRRAEPDNPQPAMPAWIIDVEKPLPYDKEELEQAKEWVKTLRDLNREKGLSQTDLSDTFSTVEDTNDAVEEVISEWLDYGSRAQRAHLRDAGHNIPIIREEDFLAHIVSQKAQEKTRAIIKNTIPMPLWDVIEEYSDWERSGAALIAPKGRVQYDEKWGASWQKEEKKTKKNKANSSETSKKKKAQPSKDNNPKER